MIYIWEPLWSQTRAHEKKGVGLTWGKKKSKNCKNVLKAKNDLKKKKKNFSVEPAVHHICMSFIQFHCCCVLGQNNKDFVSDQTGPNCNEE